MSLDFFQRRTYLGHLSDAAHNSLNTVHSIVVGQLLVAASQGTAVSISAVVTTAAASALGGIIAFPAMLYMLNWYLQDNDESNTSYNYPNRIEREVFKLCFTGVASCIGAIAFGLTISQIFWPLLIGTAVSESIRLIHCVIFRLTEDKNNYESNRDSTFVAMCR